jgi:hypothetical protein
MAAGEREEETSMPEEMDVDKRDEEANYLLGSTEAVSRFSRFFSQGGFELEEASTTPDSPGVISMQHTLSTRSIGPFVSYGSLETEEFRAIRFQVVVWYVGRPDEVLGKVDMKFRVTIFWNSPQERDEEVGYGMNNPMNKKVWAMYGRQRAYQRDLTEITDDNTLVYVPPVSILNAVDFEVLGEPEVCQINQKENLMKWSCLYKASLQQDDMYVGNFPHDSHDLVLRLGILKHRQPRKRWDKNRWKLDLATRNDTLDTIITPHGTIVDHVRVPGFSYGKEKLQFAFMPINFGDQKTIDRDQCLQIKFRVARESSYYDRNIIPLLAALNTVAISTLALDSSQFGARGEMILATSFVEIGIRMTVDSRLPVVGYQIKMQVVLNHFFFGLLFLVVESSIAYMVQDRGYYTFSGTIDRFAAVFESIHMITVLFIYYSAGSSNIFDRLCFPCFTRRLLLPTSSK